MTAAIALTQAQELVNQLASWSASQLPIDEITSRRFKREIEASKAVDARHAFIALGWLASIEWDVESVHRNFELAMRYGDVTDTLDHYSTSLQMIGVYPSAADAAERAYDRARTDLELLRKAINFVYLAGRFKRAKELCDMYDKLCPSAPHSERQSIELALAVLESAGITEEIAAKCNAIAFDLLRERRIPFVRTASEGDMIDGIMLLHIVIQAEQDVVDELDIELGERLFDEVEGFDPNHYWIGYVSSETFGAMNTTGQAAA